MDEHDQTVRNYSEWQRAYDYFNAGLFKNSLPGCVITFQRQRHLYGFHAVSQFEASGSRNKTDEIALNPSYFFECDVRDALSTLVHEMAHQHQWCFGKPSHDGYHNKAWARLMIDIGLIPTDTGKPGGKATGRRISHFIRTDGPFDRLCTELLQSGFVIPYVEADLSTKNETTPNNDQEEPKNLAELLRRKAAKLLKKKAASKSRYTCCGCEDPRNVWGKPGLNIICGDCDGRFEVDDTHESWPSRCEPKNALVADDQHPGEEW